MTIAQAFHAFWARYSSFKGKASRSEFWWNILILVLVYFVSWFMGLLSMSPRNGYLFLFHIALTIYTVAIFVPLLSVATRRYHSAGYSGVLLALYTIVMCVDYVYYEFLKVANNLANKVQQFISSPMRSMNAAGQLQNHAPHHITLIHNVFGMPMTRFLLLVLIAVAILQIYVLIQPSAQNTKRDTQDRASQIIKKAPLNTQRFSQSTPHTSSNEYNAHKQIPRRSLHMHKPLPKHPGHWINH